MVRDPNSVSSRNKLIGLGASKVQHHLIMVARTRVGGMEYGASWWPERGHPSNIACNNQPLVCYGGRRRLRFNFTLRNNHRCILRARINWPSPPQIVPSPQLFPRFEELAAAYLGPRDNSPSVGSLSWPGCQCWKGCVGCGGGGHGWCWVRWCCCCMLLVQPSRTRPPPPRPAKISFSRHTYLSRAGRPYLFSRHIFLQPVSFFPPYLSSIRIFFPAISFVWPYLHRSSHPPVTRNLP